MGIFSSILFTKEKKRLQELKRHLDSLKEKVPDEGKEDLRGTLRLIQHAEKLIQRKDKEGVSKVLKGIEGEISQLEVLVGEYMELKKTVTGSISELLGVATQPQVSQQKSRNDKK